jgi:hypothetical protein
MRVILCVLCAASSVLFPAGVSAFSGVVLRRNGIPIASSVVGRFKLQRVKSPRTESTTHQGSHLAFRQRSKASLHGAAADWFVGPDLIPWWLCTFSSALYCFLFYLRACRNVDSIGVGLQDGFCVSGNPDPLPSGECNNSHESSWKVDVVLAIFTISTTWIGDTPSPFWLALPIAILMLSHGFMHTWIAHGGCFEEEEGQHCKIAEGELYLQAFVWMLVLANNVFGLGPAGLDPQMLAGKAAVTAFEAPAIIYFISTFKEWHLQAFVASTHVLISLTSLLTCLFFNNPFITSAFGWSFLAATGVGLVELLFCKCFLKAVGGHVWYDMVLHGSMIVFMLYRDTNLA